MWNLILRIRPEVNLRRKTLDMLEFDTGNHRPGQHQSMNKEPKMQIKLSRLESYFLETGSSRIFIRLTNILSFQSFLIRGSDNRAICPVFIYIRASELGQNNLIISCSTFENYSYRNTSSKSSCKFRIFSSIQLFNHVFNQIRLYS